MSILLAPPKTLMTIVKKAPRKVTNAMDISVVGQKTIDAGTQARGGIGLKISNGGKKMSLKYLLTAKAKPKGIPIIWAIIKPAKTLPELMYQLSQYPGKNITSLHASTTSVGGGT
jgi:23S rRNA A1618 N6-methylase RlmF